MDASRYALTETSPIEAISPHHEFRVRSKWREKASKAARRHPEIGDKDDHSSWVLCGWLMVAPQFETFILVILHYILKGVGLCEGGHLGRSVNFRITVLCPQRPRCRTATIEVSSVALRDHRCFF